MLLTTVPVRSMAVIVALHEIPSAFNVAFSLWEIFPEPPKVVNNCQPRIANAATMIIKKRPFLGFFIVGVYIGLGKYSDLVGMYDGKRTAKPGLFISDGARPSRRWLGADCRATRALGSAV